jgi:hypothetical protein
MLMIEIYQPSCPVETAIAPGGTKREIETDFSNRDRKHARFKLGKLA